MESSDKRQSNDMSEKKVIECSEEIGSCSMNAVCTACTASTFMSCTLLNKNLTNPLGAGCVGGRVKP